MRHTFGVWRIGWRRADSENQLQEADALQQPGAKVEAAHYLNVLCHLLRLSTSNKSGVEFQVDERKDIP